MNILHGMPIPSRVLAAALLALVLGVAACGGPEAVEELPEPEPVEVEEPAEVVEEEPEPVEGWTEPVSGEFWYSGVRFELTEAELGIDEYWEEPQLVVGVLAENLTEDTISYFDLSDMWLEWGTELVEAGHESELESIPAGGTNRGQLVFPVDETFDLESAILYAGSPALQQAVVPLGATGELVDQAPVDAGVTGTIDAAGLILDVTGAQLQSWDARHNQLDAGSLALVFEADLRNDGDVVAHGISYDFLLDLPDGRTATPDLEPFESLWQGESALGHLLIFRVDDPPTGAYVLGLEFQDVLGTLEFEL